MMLKNTITAISVTTLVTITGCATKTITQTEQSDIAQQEFNNIYNFAPKEALSLDIALSQVLLRNQDVFTKGHEEEIARGERLYQNIEYLPDLTATINETNRDRLALSTSTRLGEEPIDGVDTTPSYSSPKKVGTENLSLKWDLLNVTKNYLTSKQKSNSEHIAKLNREKAMQNVFRDTFPAFFLTAIKQKEGESLSKLAANLLTSMDSICSRMLDAETINSVLADNCSGALSSHSNISGLLKALSDAELNLKALLSIEPKHNLLLVQPEFTDPGELTISLDKLTEYALSMRPELGVEIHKQRNAKLDKNKAYIDILPSVEIGITQNETDNPFQVNKEWEEESFTVTWNILSKVIGAPFRAKQAEQKYLLAKSRFRALVITTVTQLEIAYEAYSSARQVWLNSERRHLIASRKNATNLSQYNAGTISEIAYYQNEINFVLSSLQASSDYVKLIDAMSMLYLSVGIPLTPSLEEAQSPEHLSKLIAKKLKDLSIIRTI